ncbi:MAG: hypothetical protein JSV46_00895 [Candidatus Aminicenantes bacterium]|nr:MAG: hypothetical protein JSV46_00895 [Candidatus Aminicenantes bacterium]
MKLWKSIGIPEKFRQFKKEGGIKAIPSHWWVILVLCAVVGLLFPLIGQLTTPLHILTHEFTQLYALVTGIVLFFLARWAVKKVAKKSRGASPVEHMRRTLQMLLAGIAVMGLLTMGVMYIANVVSWDCLFHRGVPFFWVTWLPVAAWAGVGGILVGMRGWGWLKSTGLVLLVIILSLAQDLMQFIKGARGVDFILGVPLAFDQRVGMDIPEIHFYQRFFVVLLAYCFWYLALWRFGRKWLTEDSGYKKELQHFRRKALLSSTLVLTSAIFLGSYIGLGWGRAALHSELPEIHRTEHFKFFYAPGGNAENSIRAIASDAEWYWHRLSTHWNTSPKKPVEVYLFENYSHLQSLTGSESAMASINNIFIVYYTATTKTFYHELVHAIHQAGFQPKFTVWFNRGIVEGLAQAYEDELVWLPEAHRYHAGAMKSGKLPSAADFMTLLGFWKVEEALAYDSAASFIGFLIYTYGMDKFQEFQKSPDYERVFGKDISQLDIEWKQFLENVEVDVETRVRAGNYFDAAYWGAYSKECCPKLGDRNPDIENRARRLWNQWHYDKAYDLYKNLFETSNEIRWGYQVALCLQKLNQQEKALALLHDLANRENLAEFEHIKILKARASILMGLQDWPALYTTFEELASFEDGEPSEDQQIVESLLRQPGIRTIVSEALTTEDTDERRRLLENLAKSYPETYEVQYLYVTRAFRTIYLRGGGAPIHHERESKIRDLLKHIEKVPKAVDIYIDRLFYFADSAIQARNFSLAEAIEKLLLRHSQDPVHRFRAEKLKEQINFEREYALSHGEMTKIQ